MKKSVSIYALRRHLDVNTTGSKTDPRYYEKLARNLFYKDLFFVRGELYYI